MINEEVHRYKVYAHQREKKEKICAYALNRAANKVKSHAFSVWRDRNNELREHEAQNLVDKGEERIQDLEEELRDLEELES